MLGENRHIGQSRVDYLLFEEAKRQHTSQRSRHKRAHIHNLLLANISQDIYLITDFTLISLITYSFSLSLEYWQFLVTRFQV